MGNNMGERRGKEGRRQREGECTWDRKMKRGCHKEGEVEGRKGECRVRDEK